MINLSYAKYQSKFKLLLITTLLLILASSCYSKEISTTTTISTNNSTNTINPKDPVSIVEGSFVKLQQLVSQQSKEIEKNPQILVNLVNEYFIPYIDKDVMSGYAVGIKWRSATETEKKQFTEQFITLLARFYAKSVAKVGDYQLKILPLPLNAIKNKKYINVKGEIINKANSSASPLEIKMIRNNDTWQTYDVVVGGVSILNNYREQFQQATSMTQLIDRLTKMNAKK